MAGLSIFLVKIAHVSLRNVDSPLKKSALDQIVNFFSYLLTYLPGLTVRGLSLFYPFIRSIQRQKQPLY
nr:MAG TPA: hypothetical protein [Caudoviricetes sp.]